MAQEKVDIDDHFLCGFHRVWLTNKKGHLLRWPFLLVNSCDAEEPIGSERIVGENELEKRSLNLTARGGPAFAGVPSPVGITNTNNSL